MTSHAESSRLGSCPGTAESMKAIKPCIAGLFNCCNLCRSRHLAFDTPPTGSECVTMDGSLGDFLSCIPSRFSCACACLMRSFLFFVCCCGLSLSWLMREPQCNCEARTPPGTPWLLPLGNSGSDDFFSGRVAFFVFGCLMESFVSFRCFVGGCGFSPSWRNRTDILEL